ncbi:PAAR-like domain-containing protein [Sorangium sp. So ce1151]|uniref:PAAR-like domain-containing protein n=1 Tax=Sorangium sp. So ce1151 TaxID=3133332 RepID=UPI003F5E749D
MAKVTALHMDTITEKSGHQMTGMAVSVCLTPAAPSPLPIPYPTMGSVAEGIIDPCMRTKIEGAKILTVGGCMKACHGNEPGTLKEVVSLNTGGPCFPWLGAPNVLIELGMAGITGSMGQMNKSITVGAGASASNAAGGGGGGGGGGSSAGGPGGGGPQGPSNGGGGGGGSGQGADPPSPPAPPGADGQASAGHPVDVVTGAMYTNPVADLELPGPLVVTLERSYSTAAVRHRCGVGWGWSHDLAWSARRRGDELELTAPGGRTQVLSWPAQDHVLLLPFGVRVAAVGEDLLVEEDDGLARVLRRTGPEERFALVEIRDAFGNKATMEWRGDELTGIVDGVGRRARLERQGPFSWWEVTATDEQGTPHTRRAVTYELDGAGDLVRVIDGGGAEIRYEYDEEHYLIREILPDGLAFHFRYEAIEGVKRCVETWGEIAGRDVLAELGAPRLPGARGIHHTRLSYDPARGRTVVIDGEGATHTYMGNALGLVTAYVDPRGHARAYTYDTVGRLLSLRDGGGRTTRWSYNAAGHLESVTEPDGATWRDAVDEEAQEIVRTRPDGKKTRTTYRRGTPTGSVDWRGREQALEWDAHGLVRASTGPDGAELTYDYDAHGNPLRVETPAGDAYEYVFDLFGCPVEARTPKGGVYRFAYDSRFALVRLEEPNGNVLEMEIDASRRVIARSDASGITTYRYVAGALVEVARPDGRRFRLGYDALLRPRWIENAAGERHAREYDGSGNLSRETSFGGSTTSYEYDGSNHLVRTTHADGTWARYERDGAGRVTRLETSSGLVEEFQHDALGHLTHARNADVMITFERDEDGRVVREVQEAAGFAFAVSRRFDDAGRVLHRRYATGWSVEVRRREEDGAPASLEVAAAEADGLAFTRDARGESRRRRLDGTRELAWSRDVQGLPESVAILDERGEPVRRRAWTWSRVGPVAAVTDSDGGGRQYDLDVEGRPLRLHGLGADEQFTYAPQGTPLPSRGPAWSIGADGRPVRAGGAEIQWDARGRLAGRVGPGPLQTWRYQYDERDRLVSAVRGDGLTVRYLYDPLGRCVAQAHGNGESTWFGWDGESLVEERPTRGPSIQRVFDDDGFTPLLEARDGKDWRMVVTDAASTPWLYLHRDGRASEIDLGAFGRVARATGDPGALRFAGQRADPVTGLHYNRHRFYDPATHVFLTPDPIGLLGSLQEIGFVPNVTIFIDPSGLTTIVVGAPGDATIQQHVALLQAQHPGARVLRHDQLTPGSLAREDHVILSTHGAPNTVEWGNGYIDGRQLGQQLTAAGFRGQKRGRKRRIELSACNSATPAAGNGPSVAQAVADETRAVASGARSANPAATYAGTTSVGPGGHQWGPGMMAPNWTGGTTPYVHQGTWVEARPRPQGGRGRRGR